MSLSRGNVLDRDQVRHKKTGPRGARLIVPVPRLSRFPEFRSKTTV